MRLRGLAILIGVCLSTALGGCAISPADKEAAQKAWAERDAERAAECARARGRFIAGACIYGGGA